MPAEVLRLSQRNESSQVRSGGTWALKRLRKIAQWDGSDSGPNVNRAGFSNGSGSGQMCTQCSDRHSDGCKEYMTALLTHFGQWVQHLVARPQTPRQSPTGGRCHSDSRRRECELMRSSCQFVRKFLLQSISIPYRYAEAEVSISINVLQTATPENGVPPACFETIISSLNNE
jgi:hypothetical protein